MSMLTVGRFIEAGVDGNKVLVLTTMFCRATVDLLSERGYGVNAQGYAPAVTATPLVIPQRRPTHLTMVMSIADQNSALAEEHIARKMTPFVMSLHALEKAGIGTLDQPKGTKKLVLEFDPAGLLVLYQGIVGTHFPKHYGVRETLFDIESQLLGPSV